jgi:ERCC4-related helicase
MGFELGQRVLFRSLPWEVEASHESQLELFGRGRENRGMRVTAVIGLEPIVPAEVLPLDWSVGEKRWNPVMWRALHHAYRLTLAHGKGSLASVDWGRLILEPYQLVPLRRIENLPLPRLLIADDTGLGKTAEAGLVLFRLMQKRRAERVLVLTRAQPEPERWQDEMREKFGIDFVTVSDASEYGKLRREVPSHLNVFGHVPRLAMSMYFAAQSHIVDDLRRDVRWDVVIVDEAHHVAERGGKKRLAELGRVVAERTEALFLLTATPHDGKAAAWASLLRLLDPYLVIDPDQIDSVLVRPHVVRRLKQSVVKSDGTRFLRRRIDVLEVAASKEERSLDRGVRSYCKQLRARARELEKAGDRSRATGATFLETFLRKRLASSAFACGESLMGRLDRLAGKRPDSADTEKEQDRDESPLECAAVDLPSGKSEREVVEDLIARAGRIPKGSESKVEGLVKLARTILSDPAEKVVVFTEFVDTLEMLAEVLERNSWSEVDPGETSDRWPDGELFFRYQGSTPRKRRSAIRAHFLSESRVRILLATDAASESINLHKGCNNLIHYETVWNPNRYEQRNGRIDRYGQTTQPRIYLLVNKDSFDENVAAVGYQKLERIADALGSVSNVLPIASKVDLDEFLERFDEEHVDEAGKELSARLEAEATRARAEESQDGCEVLVRGDTFDEGDLREIERTLASSREFVPEFKDVEEFLRTYLKEDSGQLIPLEGEPGVFRVEVPPSLRKEAGRERILRATFQREVAVREADTDADERVEFLSPGHPLVSAALRRARGWVYQPAFQSRVSYRRSKRGSPAGFLFTYGLRFLDGRGETVEERFEVVSVGLDGRVSKDSIDDLRLFVDEGVGGNATPAEAEALATRYAAAFGGARELATREAERRSEERVADLRREQQHVADEALIRLGRWKQSVEERLQRRRDAHAPAEAAFQLAFAGEQLQLQRERERRLRQFRAEQQRLVEREAERRQEIQVIRDIRLGSLDPIGALALVPEGIAP